MVQSVQGYDPRTGAPTGEGVPATDFDGVDHAARAAATVSDDWARTPADVRAAALDAVAAALDAAVEELVDLADAETALGRPRLSGEVARTTGQLRLLADVVRDGGYRDVVISPGDAAAAQPELRRFLEPIGPVAVFAASNFPFAFSVLGGDTASALAVGCPVVVKAHEGHPRTSVRTADLARSALSKAGAPDGVLHLVVGPDAGAPLVAHPAIRAVGFTGSLTGGRALFDMAARRPDPIPFYGELGSVNPVVVLPHAARRRTDEIASGYAASLTQGVGQFCTNPGLLFIPEESPLLVALRASLTDTAGGPMLTQRIRDSYGRRVTRLRDAGLPVLASVDGPDEGWSAGPVVFQVDLDEFTDRMAELAEESFGPSGLVITYRDVAGLVDTLRALPGQLTASVHAEPEDNQDAVRLRDVLVRKAGRLVYNGWPTGVRVSWATQHGGPWPATTAPGHTSVGARSVDRWLVPVAYQGWPVDLLPVELR